MIHALRDLGKYLLEKNTSSNDLEVFIQEPFEEGKILFIGIDTDNLTFTLDSIFIEDYKIENKLNYLYRKPPSSGSGVSPCAKINFKKENPKEENTFEPKILKWFEKSRELKYLDEEGKEFINKIYTYLDNNKDSIKNILNNKLQELTKKDNKLLALKINDKYIGEFEIFKTIFLNEINKNKEETDNTSKTRKCALCNEYKDNWGKFPYKFYTIDKECFIIGGFKEKDAYKNFSCCIDCQKALETGIKYIEENLKYKFYGLNYYLIPKLLIGSFKDNDIINILVSQAKTLKLKKEIINRLTDDEDEILEILTDLNDSVSLNLFFLQKSQSAEIIVLLIENVLPSRIREIFNAKKETEKQLKEIFNDELTFTLGNIREFFYKSDKNKRDKDLDKYFLEITNRIFKSHLIDYRFLIKFFMKTIRTNFVNDNYFLPTISKAISSLLFLQNLNLIEIKEEITMNKSIFEDLFNKFGKSLNTPAKKGVFLLGALTQELLNEQYNRNQSKPFMKKLKSLKMEQRDIQSLLPQVLNKFEEYDKLYPSRKLIAEEVSNYLLEAGDNWNLTVDEINFYFSCGMNLHKVISDIAKSK